jgi:hypothetical protein
VLRFLTLSKAQTNWPLRRGAAPNTGFGQRRRPQSAKQYSNILENCKVTYRFCCFAASNRKGTIQALESVLSKYRLLSAPIA